MTSKNRTSKNKISKTAIHNRFNRIGETLNKMSREDLIRSCCDPTLYNEISWGSDLTFREGVLPFFGFISSSSLQTELDGDNVLTSLNYLSSDIKTVKDVPFLFLSLGVSRFSEIFEFIQNESDYSETGVVFKSRKSFAYNKDIPGGTLSPPDISLPKNMCITDVKTQYCLSCLGVSDVLKGLGEEERLFLSARLDYTMSNNILFSSNHNGEIFSVLLHHIISCLPEDKKDEVRQVLFDKAPQPNSLYLEKTEDKISYVRANVGDWSWVGLEDKKIDLSLKDISALDEILSEWPSILRGGGSSSSEEKRILLSLLAYSPPIRSYLQSVYQNIIHVSESKPDQALEQYTGARHDFMRYDTDAWECSRMMRDSSMVLPVYNKDFDQVYRATADALTLIANGAQSSFVRASRLAVATQAIKSQKTVKFNNSGGLSPSVRPYDGAINGYLGSSLSEVFESLQYHDIVEGLEKVECETIFDKMLYLELHGMLINLHYSLPESKELRASLNRLEFNQVIKDKALRYIADWKKLSEEDLKSLTKSRVENALKGDLQSLIYTQLHHSSILSENRNDIKKTSSSFYTAIPAMKYTLSSDLYEKNNDNKNNDSNEGGKNNKSNRVGVRDLPPLSMLASRLPSLDQMEKQFNAWRSASIQNQAWLELEQRSISCPFDERGFLKDSMKRPESVYLQNVLTPMITPHVGHLSYADLIRHEGHHRFSDENDIVDLDRHSHLMSCLFKITPYPLCAQIMDVAPQEALEKGLSLFQQEFEVEEDDKVKKDVIQIYYKPVSALEYENVDDHLLVNIPYISKKDAKIIEKALASDYTNKPTLEPSFYQKMIAWREKEFDETHGWSKEACENPPTLGHMVYRLSEQIYRMKIETCALKYQLIKDVLSRWDELSELEKKQQLDPSSVRFLRLSLSQLAYTFWSRYDDFKATRIYDDMSDQGSMLSNYLLPGVETYYIQKTFTQEIGSTLQKPIEKISDIAKLFLSSWHACWEKDMLALYSKSDTNLYLISPQRASVDPFSDDLDASNKIIWPWWQSVEGQNMFVTSDGHEKTKYKHGQDKHTKADTSWSDLVDLNSQMVDVYLQRSNDKAATWDQYFLATDTIEAVSRRSTASEIDLAIKNLPVVPPANHHRLEVLQKKVFVLGQALDRLKLLESSGSLQKEVKVNQIDEVLLSVKDHGVEWDISSSSDQSVDETLKLSQKKILQSLKKIKSDIIQCYPFMLDQMMWYENFDEMIADGLIERVWLIDEMYSTHPQMWKDAPEVEEALRAAGPLLKLPSEVRSPLSLVKWLESRKEKGLDDLSPLLQSWYRRGSSEKGDNPRLTALVEQSDPLKTWVGESGEEKAYWMFGFSVFERLSLNNEGQQDDNVTDSGIGSNVNLGFNQDHLDALRKISMHPMDQNDEQKKLKKTLWINSLNPSFSLATYQDIEKNPDVVDRKIKSNMSAPKQSFMTESQKYLDPAYRYTYILQLISLAPMLNVSLKHDRQSYLNACFSLLIQVPKYIQTHWRDVLQNNPNSFYLDLEKHRQRELYRLNRPSEKSHIMADLSSANKQMLNSLSNKEKVELCDVAQKVLPIEMSGWVDQWQKAQMSWYQMYANYLPIWEGVPLNGYRMRGKEINSTFFYDGAAIVPGLFRIGSVIKVEAGRDQFGKELFSFAPPSPLGALYSNREVFSFEFETGESSLSYMFNSHQKSKYLGVKTALSVCAEFSAHQEKFVYQHAIKEEKVKEERVKEENSIVSDIMENNGVKISSSKKRKM